MGRHALMDFCGVEEEWEMSSCVYPKRPLRGPSRGRSLNCILLEPVYHSPQV